MALPARELSVGSAVGASPWTVSDELWDRWSRCCRSANGASVP